MTPERLWLDLDRRPLRRHLLKLGAAAGPVRCSASAADRLEGELRRRWAERLEVRVEHLLLCSSQDEALRLICLALLCPGDKVHLANPGPLSWMSSVLGVGASFIDCGRLHGGQLDPAVARAVVPERLAILGAPAVTGADDVLAWRAHQGGLVVADASLSDQLIGAPHPGADASVIALRDATREGQAVLWGVVCEGASWLSMLQGPGVASPEQTRAGLATLAGAKADAQRRFELALEARAAELEGQLALGPGQRWLPRAGVERSVMCLAADGADLVPSVAQLGSHAAAYGPHPGRGLVRIQLLV